MAGNYVLLETIELTQTATSITFDNLPTSGYTDLKIVASIRGTGSNNYIGTSILLNGTSASTNWSRLQIEGGDAAVNAYTSTSSSGGYFPDGNFTANAFGTGIYYFPNYRSSNYKTINVESAGEAASTTAVYMDMFTQTWANTSAITSINMGNATSSLAIGSTFSLYGIADVSTTPATAPKATGGNIVYNDGTYWYHQFLTSGTFTAQTPIICSALVVGGGGGGCIGVSGSAYGGGGAGGTAYEYFNKAVVAGTTTVTVGAGGAGSGINAVAGTAGSTSSVILDTTYSATGGNPGGIYGVGGSNALYSGGSSDAGGNGGGGAGAGGNGGPANTGGNGTAGTAGSGFSSTILGYTVAGGSTGSANGTVPAAVDGGGRGSTDTPNYAGAAPTKFGGGGASVSTAAFRNGFNGTVVIRYAMA